MGNTAALTEPVRIGDVCRTYDPRWRIEGQRTGSGFRAWRRGTRPGPADITAETAAELAAELAAAEGDS